MFGRAILNKHFQNFLGLIDDSVLSFSRPDINRGSKVSRSVARVSASCACPSSNGLRQDEGSLNLQVSPCLQKSALPGCSRICRICSGLVIGRGLVFTIMLCIAAAAMAAKCSRPTPTVIGSCLGKAVFCASTRSTHLAA